MSHTLLIDYKQRLMITDDQLDQFFSICGVPLYSIPIGGSFSLDGIEFIVLDRGILHTTVITKDFIAKDFYINADRHCSEFAKSFERRYGFECGWQSGSLMSLAQYLKYTRILCEYTPRHDWWLSDRFTPNEQYPYDRYDAQCVLSDNRVKHKHMCGMRNGIRPIFHLSNDMLVKRGATL